MAIKSREQFHKEVILTAEIERTGRTRVADVLRSRPASETAFGAFTIKPGQVLTARAVKVPNPSESSVLISRREYEDYLSLIEQRSKLQENISVSEEASRELEEKEIERFLLESEIKIEEISEQMESDEEELLEADDELEYLFKRLRKNQRELLKTRGKLLEDD